MTAAEGQKGRMRERARERERERERERDRGESAGPIRTTVGERSHNVDNAACAWVPAVDTLDFAQSEELARTGGGLCVSRLVVSPSPSLRVHPTHPALLLSSRVWPGLELNEHGWGVAYILRPLSDNYVLFSQIILSTHMPPLGPVAVSWGGIIFFIKFPVTALVPKSCHLLAWFHCGPWLLL